MKIGKYEFDSESQAVSKIEALGNDHDHLIVHLGTIEGSEKWHVDVLWSHTYENTKKVEPESHPYGWKSYSVDPDDNGIHMFFGLDYKSYKL